MRRLLDEHRSGRRDNHKMLFSLVVLEEWLRANRGALPSHAAARALRWPRRPWRERKSAPTCH